LSKVDKSLTNAYYEIEIDPDTQLPVNIHVVILTGTKGGDTEAKGKKITGGRHVSIIMNYKLTEFGKLKPPTIPPGAQKQLAKGS